MISQATIADLPGWPCPTRVRDIATTPGSWGWLPVIPIVSLGAPVWYDELGSIWVNGDAIPRCRQPNESNESPGAIAFWTEHGIGLYIHPKSYGHLPDRTRLDNTPAESWIPVTMVGDKPPGLTEETDRG